MIRIEPDGFAEIINRFVEFKFTFVQVKFTFFYPRKAPEEVGASILWIEPDGFAEVRNCFAALAFLELGVATIDVGLSIRPSERSRPRACRRKARKSGRVMDVPRVNTASKDPFGSSRFRTSQARKSHWG